MKTIEELIQEALDHGIVDTRNELPYMINGEFGVDGALLRRFLVTVLKSAKDTGCPHFTDLADGQVNVTIPLCVEARASGYYEARQDNTGEVTLLSVTGKTVRGHLAYDMVAPRNWFTIVADVQESA
jgi:hypothetical protein